MAKPGLVIKLSKNMKPFVSRVSRGGAIQQAFKEKIGSPVGKCLKGSFDANKIGTYTAAEINQKLRACQESAGVTKGMQLPGAFIHNGPGARVERLRRKSKTLRRST